MTKIKKIHWLIWNWLTTRLSFDENVNLSRLQRIFCKTVGARILDLNQDRVSVTVKLQCVEAPDQTNSQEANISAFPENGFAWSFWRVALHFVPRTASVVSLGPQPFLCLFVHMWADSKYLCLSSDSRRPAPPLALLRHSLIPSFSFTFVFQHSNLNLLKRPDVSGAGRCSRSGERR